MKTLAIGASVALTPLALAAQPNILLLIADDMGLDASTCYDVGTQQAPMPNIEALCANGMVFENTYAAPTCSPTRASIMSGDYGFRTGVGAPVAPDGSDALSVDTATLFDAMGPAGYASNLIGKWHISGRRTGFDAPAQMGVSSHFGPYNGGIQDYTNWTAIDNGQSIEIGGYSTTVLTDRAIDWIDEQDQPWFLWLAYNAPHAPFHLPPDDLHGFDGLTDDPQAARRNPLPYYQAMLEAVDTEIGRLLASLPVDERENTVIMFIGDNGTPSQVTRDLYGRRGAKGTLYDAGTRVPFIVSGPDVTKGPTDAFVNTVDLHATIAGLANATVTSTDAVDFGPVLRGQDGARDWIYVEQFSDRATKGQSMFGWAIREGNYKLLRPTAQEAQLFDLISDPFEVHDLLADGMSPQEQAILERLQRQADQLRGN